MCIPGCQWVFNPVFALQSPSWRALSRGSTADMASTSRCCRMAPWKAQRTKAAPSVSEQSDTQRCCQLVWWKCVFHGSVSPCITRIYPCLHAKGHLKGDFLVGQSYISTSQQHMNAEQRCHAFWFDSQQDQSGWKCMHTWRVALGECQLNGILFTLRNKSQPIPGTDQALQTHVFNCFAYSPSDL